MKRYSRLIISLLIVFTVVSLAGLSSIYGYQQLVTFVFVPLVLLLGLASNNFRFPSLTESYAKYFLLILVLGVLVLPFSADISVGLKNLITLTGVYLSVLFTVELLKFQYFDFTITFLHSFIISFFILSFFVFSGVSDSPAEIGEDYIDRSVFDMNANTYSYFSYFSNMASFYLIQIKGKRFYMLLSVICAILGIYIAFITASRSGIIFVLFINMIYWLFIFNKSRVNAFLKTLFVVAILSYGIKYTYEIYENSFLKLRVNDAIESGDSRGDLATQAIIVFLQNPLTGVGPGQFILHTESKSNFSHNSFTEIAANMGVFGILLLLLLYFQPIIREIRYYGLGDKALSKLNILFFFSFILYNNFYVFYLTTYGMMVFFLILMIQRKNWNNKINQ